MTSHPAAHFPTRESQLAHTATEANATSLDDASSDTAKATGTPPAAVHNEKQVPMGDDDDRIEITEEDCYDKLGYSWPELKKWTVLSVIFLVQVSMNFNTSLYSNALGGISKEYGVSEQGARCGAMIFLVLYAFGCELWAPWSEEFGRKPILQASLLLVNIWQLPVALAPNFASIMVGRALGGLSSAGGSVTLGMIADLWEADRQQYAVAFVVFSSVGGSVLGPLIGGFVEKYLAWRWCIWIQLIFGGAVQIIHLIFVPETRTTILMNRIAKKRRESGENPNIYGPDEITPFKERFSFKEILLTWMRPFRMFLTEPIVLTLSLLSGFSDSLIFIFIQSFTLVYTQWNFGTVAQGLSFIPILIGYFIAWFAFIPAIRRNIKEREAKPDDEKAQYESRLYFLLWTAPCLPIGSHRRHRQLRHLHGHNRLHDHRLRPLLRLRHRRQRLVSRLPRRCPHHPRYPLLHQHRRQKSPRRRVHHPLLHLPRPRHRRLRHLLQRSRFARTIALCATAQGCKE